MLRPSAALFAELAARAATEPSFDGGDQGLLNSFFGDGTRGHASRRALLGSPSPIITAAATVDDEKRSVEDEDEEEETRLRPSPAVKDRRSDSGVDLSEGMTMTAMTTAAASAIDRDWFRLSFTYNMEMHRV